MKGRSGREIGRGGGGEDACFSFFRRGELESFADALIGAREAGVNGSERLREREDLKTINVSEEFWEV